MSHGEIDSISAPQPPPWPVVQPWPPAPFDWPAIGPETLIIWMLHRDGALAATLREPGQVRQVALPLPAIARALVSTGAAFLVMAHNHPSGDPCPSQTDIDGTRQVWRLARTLGAALHDHLVIGERGIFSFRASGLL